MAVTDVPIYSHCSKEVIPKVIVDYARVCVKLLLRRDGVDVEMQVQLVKMFAAECPKCIQSYATWQMGIHDYEPLLREMQVG